ncbi:MAG: addiction module protein [Gammaproteobacteria bacterium]|nr:addiction module protein [Gammaproteobacteria bacterium]
MSTKLESPPGFNDAPLEARIDLVQRLWDEIAKDPTPVSVPEEHRRILDERLKSYREHPDAGRSWAEVRLEVLRRLDKN